jgi:5-methylcytosine-specific restriction protein A
VPKRAKSICNKVGCNTLIDSPGYCDAHKREKVQSLRDLDAKRTPEQKQFYSSRRWTTISKLHRAKEPLCRRCRAEGKVVVGQLVHHDPPLDTLLAKGLNPYLDKYLETLCFNCHQKELSCKKKKS